MLAYLAFACALLLRKLFKFAKLICFTLIRAVFAENLRIFIFGLVTAQRRACLRCAAMPRRCGESLIGGSSALAVALSTVRILGPKRCALRFWLRFCVSRTRRCQLLTCSLRAVSVGRRHFGARCDGMLRPPHWQGCKSWAARCDCWRLPR